MSAARITFEVQTSHDGRWSMKDAVESEEEARALAKKVFTDKTCEGVRILRNWLRSDGQISETEISCETRTVTVEAPARIVGIETAPPPCETTEQYFGPASRDAVSRLFRSYLEKMTLTPTELMHSYKELKRLQEKDTLVPSAVDRVAQLQTREGGDPRARAQAMFKSIDDISARARRLDTLRLPPITGRFSEVMAHLPAVPGEDPDYIALAALSRELLGLRNWISKLDRLCALAAADTDPHAVEVLDAVITDLLGSSVVQDVLGAQPSLGAAICAMFDLAEGRMDTRLSQVTDSAAILNQLFAAKQLPQSRAALIERAHRQIRSTGSLSRAQPDKEPEEFRRLVDRLLGPAGFVCGAETAEALTVRQTRMVEQGGGAGRRAALTATFHAMPDRACGLIYLCEVARSPFGAEHEADLIELIDHVVRSRGIAELCARTLPPKERMLRATRAHAVVLASTFPPPVRTRAAEAIDTILESYLLRENIIEKLDQAEAPLRDRAIRLVQFCGAGVLPEGRALSRARQRVLDLLRMPSFDTHFIDGFTDPQQAQKALRDFHHLLVKAGLG